ncbi:MAG: hypothetical protein HY238_04490 [Acidobacteria bacterium]|nr:hypothetical protein [Acidobacteriota bacterium]
MSKERRETPALKLKVRGPGIRSGKIPVPDLIRICQETQNALNRQAEALHGRKTLHPGPTAGPIQEECTLELTGIRKGTTTLQFGLAKPQLPIPDAVTPGMDAIGELSIAIESLSNGQRKIIDPGVLLALYELGGVVESRAVEEVEWIAPKKGRRKSVKAAINKAVRQKVAARLSAPRKVIVQVDGVLDMADFKPKERKCRIDPAIGASVLCTFDRDKENEIYALLRKPVRAIGQAVLQPYTDRVESVHVDSIQILPSLSLGEGNFLADSSISDLAKSQQVKPLRTVTILHGGIPEDEDVDEFLQAIYDARK